MNPRLWAPTVTVPKSRLSGVPPSGRPVRQKGEVRGEEALRTPNRGCFRERGLKVGHIQRLWGNSSVNTVEGDFRGDSERVHDSADSAQAQRQLPLLSVAVLCRFRYLLYCALIAPHEFRMAGVGSFLIAHNLYSSIT